MTAPAPSPAEQAEIDRFGIFEPEARVVEEVARALFAATWDHGVWDNATAWGQQCRDDARRLAVAAVAAYRAQDGGAEEAVRRVAAVAARLDRGGYRVFAADIRDALAPQAGDGAR